MAAAAQVDAVESVPNMVMVCRKKVRLSTGQKWLIENIARKMIIEMSTNGYRTSLGLAATVLYCRWEEYLTSKVV